MEEDWSGVGFLCYFLSPGERKKVRLSMKLLFRHVSSFVELSVTLRLSYALHHSAIP